MSKATTAGGDDRDDPVDAYYRSDLAPADSPHTDLDAVPDRAIIHFDGDDEPRESANLSVDVMDDRWESDILTEVMDRGIGIQFLIERAMVDPDATVVPCEPS